MQRSLLIVSLLALGQACTPHVFSPPGRTIALEAPATVGDGETAIQVSGGASGEVFGEAVVHGGARVRHGLTDELELTVDGTAIYFTNRDSPFETSAHQGIYGARLGVKRAYTRHFALTAGMAGGGSAAGGFLSPDVGFVLGYDNPYFVPFFGGRVFLSQPLNTHEIVIVDNGMDTFHTAQTSYGFAIETGGRVPFGPREDRAGAITGGMGLTLLGDGDERRGFFGFALGLELNL